MKITLFFFLLLGGIVQARTWSDVQGRKIEADYISANIDSVTVNLNGKVTVLPLSRLCEDDQKFVASVRGKPMFAGKVLLTGGKKNEFEFPYTPEEQKLVNKNSSTDNTGYKIAIGVPDDFDPSKPQRVFIATTAINNDADKVSGNIGVFGQFAEICAAHGWVCIAYDTNVGRTNFASDLYQTFDKLNAEWPGVKTWEFAVGGFSGGSKSCLRPLAYLVKHNYQTVGAFLGGCNNAGNLLIDKKIEFCSSAGFAKVKAFISTGDKDNIVSKDQVEKVREQLHSAGMRTIKDAWFDGSHTFNHQHFEEALTWFAEK